MPSNFIDLTTAARWTKNFRDAAPAAAIAEAWEKDDVLTLLNQPGCVRMRAYYAINDDGERKTLLVAVDANGNDILATVGALVLNRSTLCPQDCSASNVLNAA